MFLYIWIELICMFLPGMTLDFSSSSSGSSSILSTQSYSTVLIGLCIFSLVALRVLESTSLLNISESSITFLSSPVCFFNVLSLFDCFYYYFCHILRTMSKSPFWISASLTSSQKIKTWKNELKPFASVIMKEKNFGS